MKRILFISLTILLIFALIATSAQAFTPPGLLRQMDKDTSSKEVSVDQNSANELPPGLQGKGVPPGLEKRGLDLPPGLEDKRDNLPPGIQMRFIDAPKSDDLGDPEVHSVHITGYNYLLIPEEDEIVVTYKTIVKDQYGKNMSDETAIFKSLHSNDPEASDYIEGVYFDHETGELTLTSNASEEEIKIEAVSDSDDSVSGSLVVKLMITEAAFVSDAKELADAIDDDSIGLIILEADFYIDKPLTIKHPVVIEGGYGDEKFVIKANENFEGWMLTVDKENSLRLYNVLLNGAMDNNENLEGLVKVEKDADVHATNNILMNAPVGFGVWMETYDEYEDQKYEEAKQKYLDQKKFNNIDEKVVFYNEEGDILYPDWD
ncbi:hypothetical protein SAMN05192551_10214 [Tindallia magadiensis]|uniref:Uncharacterized protein n=2 Tax=Tindallia magadiensis TaxID=69895 RepID=A0A1I3BSV6_9FIRM|nr:hypothetical protein SAMN05192551_10214 [Tindallia magadiensis]